MGFSILPRDPAQGVKIYTESEVEFSGNSKHVLNGGRRPIKKWTREGRSKYHLDSQLFKPREEVFCNCNHLLKIVPRKER